MPETPSDPPAETVRSQTPRPRRRRNRSRLSPWLVLGVFALGAVSLFAVFFRAGEGEDSRLALYNTLDAVLAGYLQTHGGAENLRRISSIRYQGVLRTPEREFPFMVLKKRPDQLRITYFRSQFTMVNAYNGHIAWRSTEDTRTARTRHERLSGRDAAVLIRDARFDHPLANPENMREKLRLLTPIEYDGQTFLRVQVDEPALEKERMLLLDPDSLLDHYHIERDLESGEVYEIRFSDFRRVDGAFYPFRIESRLDGELQWEMVIQRIETNVGIFESVFDPPST